MEYGRNYNHLVKTWSRQNLIRNREDELNVKLEPLEAGVSMSVLVISLQLGPALTTLEAL